MATRNVVDEKVTFSNVLMDFICNLEAASIQVASLEHAIQMPLI